MVQSVKIRSEESELPIPAGCDEEAVYMTLKHNFEKTYEKSPWCKVHLQVEAEVGAKVWKLEARLNTGAAIRQRHFRTKLRGQILESFKAHLSHDEFVSF